VKLQKNYFILKRIDNCELLRKNIEKIEIYFILKMTEKNNPRINTPLKCINYKTLFIIAIQIIENCMI